MSLSTMRGYPVRWCGQEDGTARVMPDGSLLGWVADVDVALPLTAHRRLCDLTRREMEHKREGMPHGDQKEALGRAIGYLTRHMLTENLIDDDRDGVRVAFASTERTHTRLVSFPERRRTEGGG